jgi:ribonuclease J
MHPARFRTEIMAQSELYFAPLGGLGEIGMNAALYGLGRGKGGQWLMVDVGVSFGGPETPGVDLILPDIAFIEQERRNLAGIVITHAHEDHFGALATLWPRLGAPVYMTEFAASLLEIRRLQEPGSPKIPITIVKQGERVKIGGFDVEFVPVAHSIPESCALAIRTAAGTILHSGDWKTDPTPVVGLPTDEKRLKEIGDEGVLALVSDSTNVFRDGVSPSEADVSKALRELIAASPGRVAITTFASNVARMRSVAEAATACGREVICVGRAMDRVVQVAGEMGMLAGLPAFRPADAYGYLPPDKVVALLTGSQGEPRAALARIARDDHRDLVLGEGDTVIFSSKIIPGNERDIFTLINDLVELGVKVITEKDAFTHVSGHPNRDELKKMYEWVRPTYAVPVHGEARHLEEHADFALSLGVRDAIAPRNGDLIRLAPGEPEVIDEAPSGRLLLDGNLLMPEGAAPMRERRKLSFAGLVAIAVAIDEHGSLPAPPAVTLVGAPKEAPGVEDIAALMAERAERAVMGLAKTKRLDDEAIDLAVTRAVRTGMTEIWGKRPGVAVMIQRV